MSQYFDSIRARDPAANSVLEIILTYNGLHAIWAYRVIHFLHCSLHIPILPRFLANYVRSYSGVEIHPGATIGKRFFIDHGTGVVIGETTIIGDDVTIYQGVTLGGSGKEHGKRHPTLENGVVVGSGAKVLGDIVIGEGAKIGSGSVVVKSVPPGATVVGIPGKVVGGTSAPHPLSRPLLDHTNLPDPIVERLEALQNEITLVEESLRAHRTNLTADPTNADKKPDPEEPPKS